MSIAVLKVPGKKDAKKMKDFIDTHRLPQLLKLCHQLAARGRGFSVELSHAGLRAAALGRMVAEALQGTEPAARSTPERLRFAPATGRDLPSGAAVRWAAKPTPGHNDNASP